MPSIKDFENKNKNKNKQAKSAAAEQEEFDLAPSKKAKGPRRRPGRDSEESHAAESSTHAESPDQQASEGAAKATAQSAASQTSFENLDTLMTEVHEVEIENAEEAAAEQAHSSADSFDADETRRSSQSHGQDHKSSPFEKIRIEVLGHELLSVKTPEKIVKLADSVVDEWSKDGNFESLPVNNPLAHILAAKGLRKAKDVEKKLEEKGVFALAQMGVSIIKSKLKK